jgi:hypothetical protein
MGSLAEPHFMYLFAMKNGRKKLAYGASPEDALQILSYRLTEEEMALINRDEYIKIPRTDIQKYVQELG